MTDTPPPKPRASSRSSTTRHGKGEGHGPAKGAGTGGAAHLFGPARGGGTREPFTSQTGRAMGEDKVMLAQMKAERTAMLEDHLFKLATGAEREDTQVSAAVRLHAIYNGTPVARNLNVNTDDLSALSDAELAAEFARLTNPGNEAGAGNAPPKVPGKLGGVVH